MWFPVLCLVLTACSKTPPHIPLNQHVERRDQQFVTWRQREQEANGIFAPWREAQRRAYLARDLGEQDGRFMNRANYLWGYQNRADEREPRDNAFLAQQQRLAAFRNQQDNRAGRDRFFYAQQQRLVRAREVRRRGDHERFFRQQAALQRATSRPERYQDYRRFFVLRQEAAALAPTRYDQTMQERDLTFYRRQDQASRAVSGGPSASSVTGVISAAERARFNQRLRQWQAAMAQTGGGTAAAQPQAQPAGGQQAGAQPPQAVPIQQPQPAQGGGQQGQVVPIQQPQPAQP